MAIVSNQSLGHIFLTARGRLFRNGSGALNDFFYFTASGTAIEIMNQSSRHDVKLTFSVSSSLTKNRFVNHSLVVKLTLQINRLKFN